MTPRLLKWNAKSRRITRIFICPMLFIVMLLTVVGAGAQECPSPERHKISSRVPLIRNMVNPNPLDYDFELPTPCGGKLVFRLVCVPATGYLDDLELEVGCLNCGRQAEGYMERKRLERLSGPFTLENLPDSWQKILLQLAEQEEGICKPSADRQQGPFYYFISKYEITNFHWDAVMEDECPGWDRLFTTNDPRPKTEISWYEAVEFTKRLTEWLLENHPETMPGFSDGRYGFIRLPTETEWEYAARGGHRVSSHEMNQEAFFPLKNRDLTDYAVYTEAYGPKPPEKLAWIGTKCSNPLGLFDTAGNASEMTLEPFRFSIGSDLHGAVGGFLIKGGSYRKSSWEIMPGRREEMPYFLGKSAYKSYDVGFRVVLAGIITPRDRLADLKEQWASYADEQALNKIVKEWTKEEADSEQSAVLEAQRINGALWKALFILESLVKYYESSNKSRDEFEMLQKLNKSALPESEIKLLNDRTNSLVKRFYTNETAINDLMRSYLQTILIIKSFPIESRTEQLTIISKERVEEPSDQYSISRRLAVVNKHIETLSPRGLADQYEMIFKEIISLANLGN